MSLDLHPAGSGTLHYETVFGRRGVRVLPGEFHATAEDIVLVTVLGSCVAACIRDAERGVGGMNHFMLPDAGPATGSADSAPARYGTYAMEVLINQLVKLGARRHRLEAKVFGGANVIPGMNQVNIGHRNARFVLDFLATERIVVRAQDLADTCPRKVAYFPRTGEARVKRLNDALPANVASHEKFYQASLARTPVAGAIELFD
ncbi:chemoreceptor glutamine deamidase CheD [Pseudacidovorax sp. RU35E]|uniref:chemoreceptor glutamine deamidase CheD n=1 Tax=Pseudacidovorax sp. RU35E TaxID=1907403 RepID=UPI000955FD78|nr:chemoreceptor glutamine deamidase CheD [Pseudacidovorax sp. RU35E]SIQ90840.1 chemotaxis protein CheD [Pseudacidovorax sp. RU35E]